MKKINVYLCRNWKISGEGSASPAGGAPAHGDTVPHPAGRVSYATNVKVSGHRPDGLVGTG